MMKLINNPMPLKNEHAMNNPHAGNISPNSNRISSTPYLLRRAVGLLMLMSVTAWAATVPNAPTSVTAVGASSKATVTFVAPASNGGSAITGYTVSSSPAGGTDFNAGSTGLSHVINGLSNGTAYTFTVIASNAIGNSDASAASNSVTPALTVPSAPRNVTAVGGNAQATVSFLAPWSSGGTSITGYTVSSSPAGGTDTNAGSTGFSHVMTGLSNGTVYTFTVTATNAIGSSIASVASNSVTPAGTATVPNAPTSVTAVGASSKATVTFVAPASNGGSAITGYTVSSSPAGGTDFNAGSTGLSHVINGLSNGTAYTFTVIASNAIGNSDASAASNSVTPALTVPSAPRNVTAVGGNAQATVSFLAPWSSGGTSITGYTVSSSPAGGTDTNAGSTGLSHVMTGLSNGTVYTFTVTATNAIGTSIASVVSNSVTPAGTVTVSVTATPNPATAGQAAVLNATITGTNPTGIVTFKDGATTLGTGTLTAGAASLSYTFNTAGAHSITAVYAGDANNATSTSTAVNLTVNKVASTTALNVTPNPAKPSDAIVMNATITGFNPAGSVTFMDGATVIGTSPVNAGIASFTTSFTAMGSHALTAMYSGDPVNTPSTSVVVSLTVNSGVAQVYYIHIDQLNTPREITDTSGAVVWQWDNSDPFGNNSPNENPANQGTFTFNLRFAGQYFDRETNTHYNVNRDYDPATGRYIQSDPIGLWAGINTYAYVEGNPLIYVDPFGLDVYLCSQPAFGWAPVDHQWIKTDTAEAGMGGTKGNVPGNQSGDMPGDPVQVTDHSGRSEEKGSSCEVVPNVDESKVNKLLKIGRPLGNWTPGNQCQSFAHSVLSAARNSPGASGSWSGSASGSW